MTIWSVLRHRLAASWTRNFKIRNAHGSYSTAAAGTDVDDTDTLIIGGGVVGTSIAYHLAKKGVKNVVLLEQLELTAGSTWHAAGLTTHYSGGVNAKRLHYESLQLFKTLTEETGQELGFHPCGSLRLATTPTRVDEFRYQMARQGWHGHEGAQILLSAEETMELHPLLNPDKVLGSLYTPGDGHIDPYSITQAFATGARQHGARITFAKVTATEQRVDGRWWVETDKGAMTAGRVVNAAGTWARDVGQMAGIDLPLVNVHHTYLTTGPIPEVEARDTELPVVRDVDCSTYTRQERGGLCVGTYESETFTKLQDTWYDKGVDPGFGKELFESDLDAFQDNFLKAMETVPVLKTANIRKAICGPICYPPHAHPMVGPYQGLKNYWLAVGMGSGIIQSGGVGNYITDWMVNGEPPYHLVEMEPSIYGTWTDRAFTLAKAREAYSNNYTIVFTKEDKQAGRPTTRVTPMYDVLARKGAKFGYTCGWEQANYFATTPDEAEYQPSFRRTNWFSAVARETAVARKGVAVVDLSASGKYDISGKDTLKWCDRIYTRSYPKLHEWGVCHILTPTAKVYAEHLVARLCGEHMFCVTGAASERHDLRWMENVADELNFDIKIKNVSDERGCLRIIGPKSADVMKVLNEEVHGMVTPQIKEVMLCDMPVIVIKASLSGENGWELYPLTKDLVPVYEMLMDAGKPHGIADIGIYAYNTLRLESGSPAWGTEFKLDYDAIESNLCHAIETNTEAQFIGKERVIELQGGGRKRGLVLLEVGDLTDADPEGNETVWCDGKVVGNTTSGCYSHNFTTGLAFAYVTQGLTQPGSKVSVEVLGGMYPATVLSSSPLQTTKQ